MKMYNDLEVSNISFVPKFKPFKNSNTGYHDNNKVIL